jgi:hypothetical protein
MAELPRVKKDVDDFLKTARRRPWREALASLAAAVGASFAMTSAVPASPTAQSTQGPPALTHAIRRSKSAGSLILCCGTQVTRLTQHESHESHESHASHESHESHYSGQ